ncbi:class I SAM-dependent methyltransferase [Yinghuangia sp. ASG 101]|uniref:SAM-dependent methyltransferase n=1 Tax=Yinghuangia sp. ASG 101 TaxID=2896848 RepID=UPI001E3F0B81|nr:class I SAM-dependent methyltransferase [Yinghuangia sp. ASG 101]UGQ12783.1 class I SAM-dependent methyltransferase [Yinghuangia sp. ASG 101]
MSTHHHDHAAAPGTPLEFWENLYDGPERRWRGTPNPRLVETAEALTPGRALDLGCGEGGDAVWLARRGWRVTAVDLSANALARTARYLAEAGVADRVELARHDLAETFPDGVFDLVSAQYFQSPFELPRAEVLRKAAHALVPGGLLLVVEHGSAGPWSSHGRDMRFPTPEEIRDDLALDPAEWPVVRLDLSEREAIGPNGETGTVLDTVVAVRRRS